MDTAIRFWDRIAERYAARPVPDEAAYGHKLARTAEYLESHQDVLEVGCGTGTTALHHASRVKSLRAVDASPNMIAIAEAKAREAGVDNVHFEVSTIEGLAVPPASVDVVMAHNILHLLRDWQGALARFHEVLRPGGVLVSSTACIADKMGWFALVGPVGHALGLLPLVRVFKREQLLGAMEDVGFQVQEQWVPEGGKSHGVFVVARRP